MRPFLFVGALALALFSSPALAPVEARAIALARVEANTTADHGGYVDRYKAFVGYAKKHHVRVTIRGECDSSCLLKLGVGPTLRIAPDAIFGAHEVRQNPASCDGAYDCYRNGVRDEVGIADFRANLPVCADTLFMSRNGFGGPQITEFTGAEVLAACPQIMPIGSIRGRKIKSIRLITKGRA